MRQCLQFKSSYAKFNLATLKFKRVEAFVPFKNEVWQLDNIAFGIKMVGVKFLLAQRYFFD